MIKRDDNGYYFVSEKTQREYGILECVSIGGDQHFSSDVIAIFYSGNVDTGEPSEIIGHYWGASSFEPDEDNRAIIAEIVAKYENK